MESKNDNIVKLKWNQPELYSLDIKKTSGGTPYEGNEDASYNDPTQSP